MNVMRLNALLALSFMLALAAQVPAARAAQSACTAKPGYPAPNEPGQVFYLQRTSNANTVIYALNFDGTGKVDAQHPVDVYWRRYAEKGQRKELGFFERTFAFGARYAPLKGAPGRYRAHLVSYPALEVEVEPVAPGKARGLLEISGRPAVLDCIYIELLTNSYIPEIGHIDIVGRTLEGDERVSERLFVDQRAAGMAPGDRPAQR